MTDESGMYRCTASWLSFSARLYSLHANLVGRRFATTRFHSTSHRRVSSSIRWGSLAIAHPATPQRFRADAQRLVESMRDRDVETGEPQPDELQEVVERILATPSS